MTNSWHKGNFWDGHMDFSFFFLISKYRLKKAEPIGCFPIPCSSIDLRLARPCKCFTATTGTWVCLTFTSEGSSRKSEQSGSIPQCLCVESPIIVSQNRMLCFFHLCLPSLVCSPFLGSSIRPTHTRHPPFFCFLDESPTVTNDLVFWTRWFIQICRSCGRISDCNLWFVRCKSSQECYVVILSLGAFAVINVECWSIGFTKRISSEM